MFDHFEWVKRSACFFSFERRRFNWRVIANFHLAASSKKPPITHEDVNSIFLNTYESILLFDVNCALKWNFSREIILFLHQIFYKGLSKKLENWPTFYTGRTENDKNDFFFIIILNSILQVIYSICLYRCYTSIWNMFAIIIIVYRLGNDLIELL